MLKHLKGARLMQDCKTGQLFVDTGGQCLAMGGSWDALKDKPFYAEHKRILCVSATGPISDHRAENCVISNAVEVGKTYTVNLNGTEYNAVAVNCGEFVGLGNGAENEYYDYKADVPFWFEFWHDFTNLFIGEDEITVTVYWEGETVHKLDAKYLPDPFWVEEKRTIVVEGVPVNDGNYNIQSQLEVGKEYTYSIDGIEHTGVCVQDDIDKAVYLQTEDKGNNYAVVYEYGITLNNMFFDISVSHKIELVEKVYHTHHDFIVIRTFNDDTGEGDTKVVAGDFAAAKAKILKGLPATAYICETVYGDGWQEVRNLVDKVCYVQEPEFEGCILDLYGVPILPDNTIPSN